MSDVELIILVYYILKGYKGIWKIEISWKYKTISVLFAHTSLTSYECLVYHLFPLIPYELVAIQLFGSRGRIQFLLAV